MSGQLVSQKYRKRSRMGEIWHRLKKNKGAMLGLAIVILLIVIAIAAGYVLDYETQIITQTISERLQHPSAKHLMGTDQYGRDIFYRLLYGSHFPSPWALPRWWWPCS